MGHKDQQTWIISDEIRKNILQPFNSGNSLHITSYAQLQQILRDSASPDSLVICLELGWEEEQISRTPFPGYQIFKQLFIKSNRLNPPLSLGFVSHYSRTALFSAKKNSDKAITKSFPHLRFDELQDNPSFPLIKPKKFKFLQRFVLSDSGYLSVIRHRISNLLSQSQKITQKSAVTVVDELDQYKAIAGEAISELIQTVRNQIKTSSNLKQPLRELSEALQIRMMELFPSTEAHNNDLHTKDYSIFLIEDEAEIREKLTRYLSSFFQVRAFANGEKARKFLLKEGQFIHAVICDLKLLQPDSSFDQPVQGYDILELAEEQFPHLVRRVITGMGRRVIKELFPEMKNKDILYKSLLSPSGADMVLFEFIDDLIGEIRANLPMMRLKGPETKFWADSVKSEAGIANKFKRFYYYLLTKQPKEFEAIWENAQHTLEQIQKLEQGELSGNSLPPIKWVSKSHKNVTEWVTMSTIAEKASYLELLLSLRLYFLWKYNEGDTVVYKDEYNGSLINCEFISNLPVIPKRFLSLVGLGSRKLSPSRPNSSTSKITFSIVFNTLFPHENEWLKHNKSEVLEDFYLRFEDLCIALDQCLFIIEGERKNRPAGQSSQFQRIYPELLNNTHQMNQAYATQTLKGLSSESKVASRWSHRQRVYDTLQSYEEKCEQEFDSLPTELQELVEKALGVI